MPLHVSSTMCSSSSGGQNCIIQHLVSSHLLGAVRCTGCALCWLITKIILRFTVSKTSKYINYVGALAIMSVLAISIPVSYDGGPGVGVFEKLTKRHSHNKVIPRILRRPEFITVAIRAPSDPYASHTKSRRCKLNTPNCN